MKLYRIKKYKVLYDTKHWTCDCRAGKNGLSCKHIQQAKKLQLYGEAKMILEIQINNAIADFTQQFPEIQKVIFEGGEIKIIL